MDHELRVIDSKNGTGSVRAPPPNHDTISPASINVSAVDARNARSSHFPVPSVSDDKRRSTWRMTAVIIALFLSLFVAALDATIVATAAPTISSELNSAAGYTWIGAAYLLAHAASGPIWAKLSDIWGRKMVLLIVLAIFFATSAVCASAKTMEALIVGRALQGVAGGGLILMVHVCISDLFSLRQRSLLMGLTEGIWAIAGGVGPILGGIFASLVSWRWCFYINLPISGLASLLIILYLDVKHEHTSFVDGIKAIDWLGIFTFLCFTLMVLAGLNLGGAIFPWSSGKVIALLVVGGVLIFVFIWSEKHVAKYPLIPMDMFKKKTIVATCVVTFCHGFAFIAAEYYMPLYLQSVLEATPLKSGLLLLPFIVAGAVAGMICGVIMHRTGRFQEIIWGGSIVLCLGFGLFITLDASSSTARVVGLQVLAGIGSCVLFAAPIIAVQSQVAQDDVSMATSTLAFFRNMAIAVSVVIGGTIFQNSMDDRASFLREAGLSSDLLQKLTGRNAMANVMLPGTITNPAWELAVKQAFSWATRNMWITYTVFALFGVVASVFVAKADLGTEHTETVTGLKKEKIEAVVDV